MCLGVLLDSLLVQSASGFTYLKTGEMVFASARFRLVNLVLYLG